MHLLRDYLRLFVCLCLEFCYTFPACVRKCFCFFYGQKLPKVNKELALKLMEEGDEEAGLASRKKKGKVGDQWLQAEASDDYRRTKQPVPLCCLQILAV